MESAQPTSQAILDRFNKDKARSASKYDYVKVKVWLGEEKQHYYVLSRFLISRSLTVTKIPHMKAVKIALELKKHCVDNDLLEVTQAQLEEILFQIMRGRGFGDLHVQRYKMVTKFHLQRRPLIIFISGSACTGKSTLAQQVAARLNLPNVLQTDIIYELLRTTGVAPLNPCPLWQRTDLQTTEELLAEFHRECGIVRKGIDADLGKCIRDGKSFIIEGLHLEPGLYLYEFGRYGLKHLQPAAPACAASSPDSPQRAAAATAAAVISDAECSPAGSQEVDAAAASTALRKAGAAAAELSINEAAAAAAAAATEMHSEAAKASAGRAYDGQAAAADASRRHMLEPEVSGERATAPESAMGATTVPAQQQQEAGNVTAECTATGQPAAAADTMGLMHEAQPTQMVPEDARQESLVPHESTRQRIKQRLRRLPGRSISQEEVTPTQRQPPPKRSASGGRVLFALRRGDQSDGSGLQPRLAPWPAAKVLLEAFNPLRPSPVGKSEAVDIALASLHLKASKSKASDQPQQAQQSSQGQQQQQQQQQQQEAERLVLQPHSSSRQAEDASAQPSQQVALHPGEAAAAGAPPSLFLSASGAVASPPGPDQHSSVSTALKPIGASNVHATADATGIAASLTRPEAEDAQPGPVFVPIVLAMDEADHQPLLDEWFARQQGDAGLNGCKPEEAFARLQAIQGHLCTYKARAVPVVPVSTAGFTRTLDDLHDYLLQCMELAMSADP